MSIFKFGSIYVLLHVSSRNYSSIVCMNNEYAQKFNCLKLKIANLVQLCAEPTGKLLTLFLSLHCTFHHVWYVWLNIFFLKNTSTQVLASSTLPTLSHCQWRDVWWKEEIKVSSFGSNCSGDVQQSRRFYIPTVPVVRHINKNILYQSLNQFREKGPASQVPQPTSQVWIFAKCLLWWKSFHPNE